MSERDSENKLQRTSLNSLKEEDLTAGSVIEGIQSPEELHKVLSYIGLSLLKHQDPATNQNNLLDKRLQCIEKPEQLTALLKKDARERKRFFGKLENYTLTLLPPIPQQIAPAHSGENARRREVRVHDTALTFAISADMKPTGRESLGTISRVCNFYTYTQNNQFPQLGFVSKRILSTSVLEQMKRNPEINPSWKAILLEGLQIAAFEGVSKLGKKL